MQKSVDQITCFDRRDLKQMSVRGGTELSGRNINIEDVSKASGTRLNQSQKRNRWKKLVVDSLTDWQPVECMLKERNMLRCFAYIRRASETGRERSPYDLMLTHHKRERTFTVRPSCPLIASTVYGCL